VIITLPWPTASLSPNSRAHYMVKHKEKKAYREACAWQAKSQGLGKDWPDGKISVHLTFIQPDKTYKRDHDNMISSMKAGIDGLADVMGVNDHRFVISSEVSEDIGGMVKVKIEAVK
jgi:crossover junction endodeoxyribonuclease RusA